MVAGRGIVHSERTTGADLAGDMKMEGIQAWIGLPAADEETDPSFAHHAAHDLPVFDRGGVKYRIIAGTAFGETAPVRVFSPIFYLHGEAPAGSVIDLPATTTNARSMWSAARCPSTAKRSTAAR